MSNHKIHINPLAKSKNEASHKTKLSKPSKFANQFSWVIVLVFSVSTFAALGLIFNEIKGNVGLAAQDLAGYSTWKTQYGFNSGDADTNWNKAGDGVSNYNKYLLGLNPNEVIDGSILVASTAKTDASTTFNKTTTNNLTGKLAASTDPTSKSIEANGPSLAANTTTTANTGSGSGIKPNIAESTNPKSADPTNNVPILGNPTPSATGQIVASNPNTIPDGTKVAINDNTTTSAGAAKGTSASGGATANSISNTGTNSTVKTSGNTVSTSTTTTEAKPANTTAKTTTKPVAGKNTVTVRTGGEFNMMLFLAGLASLISGAYILKTKFTKNSLVVQQGEK